MATLGRYCKAYPLTKLQEFSDWKGYAESHHDSDLTDESVDNQGRHKGAEYLFVQENLVVTGGVFKDEAIVFDAVTPEWELFCRDTLGFKVPEGIS